MWVFTVFLGCLAFAVGCLVFVKDCLAFDMGCLAFPVGLQWGCEHLLWAFAV